MGPTLVVLGMLLPTALVSGRRSRVRAILRVGVLRLVMLLRVILLLMGLVSGHLLLRVLFLRVLLLRVLPTDCGSSF
jgi:hypothetical protein